MKITFEVQRKGKTVKTVTDGAVSRIEKAIVSVTQSFVGAAKRRCPVSGTVKAGWVMRKARRGVGFRFVKVRLPEASARIPGRLRASIIGRSWGSRGRYFGSCGFTVDYGIFVEFGTSGPSAMIRPVRKKALAWYGPGREVFVRKHSRGGPIRVGTAQNPREASSDPWEAAKERRARRQSMPFLRPAWNVDTLPMARKRFKDALKKTG